MSRSRRTLSSACRRYLGERSGAAAAEFALVVIFLVVPLLNLVDLGLYVYERMLLDNATQVSVQSALATCPLAANLPATPNSYQNCPALPSAIANAAKSTALGSSVSVTSITESYSCPDATGTTLQAIPGFPARPAPNDCHTVNTTTNPPGDYIQVTTSYTYAPLFAAVSVAGLLTTPITRTAWMRLG
jgi:Flp pilus assembly protein TadG